VVVNETGVWVGDEVPHADKLNEIFGELLSLRDRIDAVTTEMASLCDVGVFLDGDARPVVPGLSERKENGRVVGYVQVWPTAYAREAGVKRRKYVRKGDVEQVRARIERTEEYGQLQRERDRLTARLSRAGERLEDVFSRGW
jgi:hypothetical protein